MVRSLNTDDILSFSNMSCKLDSSFDRFSARVPEEERVERVMRHDGLQSLDQFEIRTVEAYIDLSMDKGLALLLGCLRHNWMTAETELDVHDSALLTLTGPGSSHLSRS